MTDQSTRLTWDVYVTAPEPTVNHDMPPAAQQRLFSPPAATLIWGERDAVLVDALLTAGRHDDPDLIEETRQYLRNFDRLAAGTCTARDLYEQMRALKG